MSEQNLDPNVITKEGNVKNPVDLIFPLVTEITLEISKIPAYILELKKIFDFYNKQLNKQNKQIKNYNIQDEISGLMGFFGSLESAIASSNASKPILITDPTKTSIKDYEFITLRVIPNISELIAQSTPGQISDTPTPTPLTSELRTFSDGSNREVLIYNKIHYIYLTNKTIYRSLAVLSEIDTSSYGISPSTLSLMFNIKRIVDEQLNAPIDSSLLLCKGQETALSKLEDGFSFFGFDIDLVSSKVLINDFLNAYIHPQQEIASAPRPQKPKGCTPEVRNRVSSLRDSINLYQLRTVLAPGFAIFEPEAETEYLANKKELFELTKICPDLASTIAPFESLKELEEIGQIFSQFLEKFNIACIIDEAIKCVAMQIPCEDLLRDLSVDNFESRLQAAFPHQKNMIAAIVKKVKDSLEEEKQKREREGGTQLTADEQTQKVLDTINMFIDIEAICKLDINAIIALFKSLTNFEFPKFNMFDWQFNLMVDFDLAIIKSIISTLLSIINQILDELVGCDSLDNLVAGILNGNMEGQTGLYGDIASIFGGNFDFESSNLSDSVKNGMQQFLTQSSQDLGKIISFEVKIGNPVLGNLSTQGNLGIGTQPGAPLVGTATTSYDTLGGLARASVYTTGSAGLGGFSAVTNSYNVTVDVTKLSSSQGQSQILEEIGKFTLDVTNERGTEIRRISDDSIVQLLSIPPSSISASQITQPGQIRQELTEEERFFASHGVRTKNSKILHALVVLNESEGRANLLIPPTSLSQQIKEYVKTCFALLSPSEVIDLLSANSSKEVKVTIAGIAKVRFPLLYAILQYPDRHAMLFASFGKLTQLDSLAPRLQILASNPIAKKKMVDPNICRPFASLADFREALMNQVLPAEFANNLIDDLMADDLKRANDLMNSLASGNVAGDLNNPDALSSPNKTFDGKPIEEMNEAVNSVTSLIFDQVKLKFDDGLQSFPRATQTQEVANERIYKYLPDNPIELFGFKQPEGKRKNLEYQRLIDAGLQKSHDYTFHSSNDEGDYVLTKKTDKIVGGLYNQILGNTLLETKMPEAYSINAEEPFVSFVLNGNLPRMAELSTFITASVEQPKWKIEYSEYLDNTTKMFIRTAGDVQIVSGEPIQYAGKLQFEITNSISQQIQEEIRMLGISGPVNRFSVFKNIFMNGLDEILQPSAPLFSSYEANIQNLKNSEAFFNFRNLIFAKLNGSQDYVTKYASHLLDDVKPSFENSPDSNTTKLINLIDFSPLPTQQQKDCGIDTHLLQIESLKQRIFKEYDSTIPEDVINTNSLVNTRYSSQKPGQLPSVIMTGLAETFIRTCVAHSVFSGLFVLDNGKFSLSRYSNLEVVYSFIEKNVLKESERFGFKNSLLSEVEKIYNLYRKEEPPLVENTDSENRLNTIIKYHFNSIVELLGKMLGYKEKLFIPPGSIPTGFDEQLYQQVRNLGININTGVIKNKNYLQDLTMVDVYSSFWRKFTSEEFFNNNVPSDVIYDRSFIGIRGDLNFKSNTSYIAGKIDPTDMVKLRTNGSILVLEKYIKLSFNQNTPYTFQELADLQQTYFKNDQINGKLNIDNYFDLVYNIVEKQRRISYNGRHEILFDKTDKTQENRFWLNETPKLGLRLSLLRGQEPFPQSMRVEEDYNDKHVFPESAEMIDLASDQNTKNKIFKNNKKNKIGTVKIRQNLIIDEVVRRSSNAALLDYITDCTIVPLVEKEIELPENCYDMQLAQSDISNYDNLITTQINNILPTLMDNLSKDPTVDVLLNYCLLDNIEETMILLDNLVGMAAEPVIKLFDSTKETIIKNYNIQKEGGNFKKKQGNLYEKAKKTEQGGPPSADYIKAATTIPIGILKGLSVAVDPNIFLADKIVLAGKMGFIQPKFRRVEVGEEIKIQGSSEVKIIESGEEGIATSQYYNYLQSGQLEMKITPDTGGSPYVEYTVIAEVDPQTKKIKKLSDGKYVTKQGPTAGRGVPWNIRTNSPVDSDIDPENTEIGEFEQALSAPIFPGESINIPYSIASLALAPFPVFSPGLTTYNIAMPFGPLFLALEPLIMENPQFKASEPKRPETDTGGNLSCDDK